MKLGDFKLYFFGVGGTHPTRERGVISIGIKANRNLILLDCGEGTLRRIFQLGLSPMKIKAIALSHVHGDHVWGIFSILETLALYGRKEALPIIGPKGTYDFLSKVIEAYPFWREYEIKVIEVKKGDSLDLGEVLLEVGPAEHNCEAVSYKVSSKEPRIKIDPEKLKSLGISPGPKIKKLIEKGEIEISGRKVKLEEVASKISPPISLVYSGDTRPLEEMVSFAKGVDLLIHDATYTSEYENVAYEYFHSTSVDAARIAKEAGVKMLYLIHFSPRVRDPERLVDEARKVFKRTYLARELSYLDLLRLFP